VQSSRVALCRQPRPFSQGVQAHAHIVRAVPESPHIKKCATVRSVYSRTRNQRYAPVSPRLGNRLIEHWNVRGANPCVCLPYDRAYLNRLGNNSITFVCSHYLRLFKMSTNDLRK
jgi:hypothetical protein